LGLASLKFGMGKLKSRRGEKGKKGRGEGRGRQLPDIVLEVSPLLPLSEGKRIERERRGKRRGKGECGGIRLSTRSALVAPIPLAYSVAFEGATYRKGEEGNSRK